LNAEKVVERADAEVARKNWDGAVEYFLQALAIDPDHRGARRGLRVAELARYELRSPGGAARAVGNIGGRFTVGLASMTRDPRRRMEALEKALAGDPRNADLGLKLGAEAEAGKFLNAAAAAYEGVLLGNPQHTGAMKALGKVLRALGDVPGALAALEQAVKTDPRDQEASRLRKDMAAESYALGAGFATAKTTHDLLRDKDQAKRLEKAQRIVHGEEDLEGHARETREAAAAAPGDPERLVALGMAEAALRRYDEAEAAIAKACALAPNDGAVRAKLGDVRIGRAERLLSDTRQAAERGDAAAAGRLAAAEKARLEVLVAEYRSRVAGHPTDLGLRFALAGWLEQAGRVDEAAAEYQQSVRDPRRRAESLGGLGRCFLAKGMYDLAAKQIEKALEESGGAGEKAKGMLYDLGVVKEKQGDLPKAREYFARVFEVDIGYRDVAQRLEALQRAAGGAGA